MNISEYRLSSSSRWLKLIQIQVLEPSRIWSLSLTLGSPNWCCFAARHDQHLRLLQTLVCRQLAQLFCGSGRSSLSISAWPGWRTNLQLGNGFVMLCPNIGYTMVQWHTQIPQHPIVHHHFFPYLSFVYLYLTWQCWIVLAANWANPIDPISFFLALKPARSLLLLCWAEGILQWQLGVHHKRFADSWIKSQQLPKVNHCYFPGVER